jgi:flagellar biosynthesis protein FliP
MTPTWINVYENAIIPYQNKEISQDIALKKGIDPFKTFMLKFTRQQDLALFIEFSRIPEVTDIKEVPIYVLIPAFMISELKTAFQIGFMLFIPFIVIDLVVSNILLSLGMFMLSPVMISLPFKILLFVLVDGWNLIVRGLLSGFQ